MEVLGKKISVSVFKLIILLASISIIILGYFVWETDTEISPKKFSILGGLLTGFIVGLFQLLLSWFEHSKIQKFEDMKIINVMANRDDRGYYESLIKKAKEEISLMGVTASRFVEHFADIKGNREDCKALLFAMTRGVKVKFLLPDPNYLDDDNKQIAEKQLRKAFEAIKEKYKENFEFKYFDHEGVHSIFIVDDKCILGPVFPKVSSKDTPAIHSYCNSPFAKRYLDYFNSEWENAK